MNTNEKMTYTPVDLEVIHWGNTEDVIATSGFKGPETDGHTVPAYIRYEEDESVD